MCASKIGGDIHYKINNTTRCVKFQKNKFKSILSDSSLDLMDMKRRLVVEKYRKPIIFILVCVYRDFIYGDWISFQWTVYDDKILIILFNSRAPFNCFFIISYSLPLSLMASLLSMEQSQLLFIFCDLFNLFIGHDS